MKRGIFWLSQVAIRRVIWGEWIESLESKPSTVVFSAKTAAHELRTWPAKSKIICSAKRSRDIDLHYRDYEEPPGNGGFTNGGRLYRHDMAISIRVAGCLNLQTGHVEWPRLSVATALIALAEDRVSFIKTRGHNRARSVATEYLMRREASSLAYSRT